MQTNVSVKSAKVLVAVVTLLALLVATATLVSCTPKGEALTPKIPFATQIADESTNGAPWNLPENATIKFAVIGDYGLSESELVSLDVARLINQWDVDLILTTGDNNYPDGTAQTIDSNVGRIYYPYIGNYKGQYGNDSKSSKKQENGFFPTLGNHDWDTANAQPYIDYFSLPGNERYYDFVRGNVHFWALDSDPSEPDSNLVGGVQAEWLRAGLAVSKQKFNVVYFHHPPFNSRYRPDNCLQACKEMRWPFKSWGADLVISGHAHHYERVIHEGLNYVTNGLGGHTFRHGFTASTEADGNQSAGPIVEIVGQFVQDYGAMRVYATDQVMKVQFVTRAGLVVDTFSLSP